MLLAVVNGAIEFWRWTLAEKYELVMPVSQLKEIRFCQSFIHEQCLGLFEHQA